MFFKKSDLLFIGMLFLLCLAIFIYFINTTESRYEDFPAGDATFYTLMAIHYSSPHLISEPIPVIYANRLLPSYIVGLISSGQIPKAKVANLNRTSMLKSREFWGLNTIIRKNFLKLNFAANFLTVVFLYLILLHFNCSRTLSFALSLLFMSFFIPVRLYVFWPQMADPMGFMFLSAIFYFFLRKNWPAFFVLLVISVFVRENSLLFLTCFWTYIFVSKFSCRRRVFLLLFSFIPIIAFFYFRANPYFSAQIMLPNTQFNIEFSSAGGLMAYIRDYLFIIHYHLSRLISRNLLGNTVLIPFYTLGVLLFLLLAEWKEAVSFFKEHIYFLPFIVFTMFLGINIDRQFFWLFPVFFSAAGVIISRGIPRQKDALLFVLVIFCLNIYLYDHFLSTKDVPFAYYHQLEYVLGTSKFVRIFFKTICTAASSLGAYFYFKKNKGAYFDA